MKEKECCEKLCSILLYAAYVIELAVVLVDKSELINPFESYIFRLTFAMTLLVVLLSDHTAKGWLLILCGALLGITSYRITGRNELLRMVIFAAACAGQPRKRMMKTAFFVTAGGCVLIALLSITGIFGARSITQVFRTEEGVATRYCFGFGHPNALHAMFCMLVLLGLAVFADKIRWWHLALLFAANAGLYLFTDSRTGVALTAFGILMAGFACFLAKKKWFYAVGAGIVAFCVAFSVWAAERSPHVYDMYKYGDQLRQLNILLSYRIAELWWVTPAERADLSTWTLFSSPAAERFFDMGWCRLFYWYGIIPAAVVIGAVFLLIWLCARRRDGAMLVYIVSASIYTVVEAHLVSVYIGRNYLLPVWGIMFAEYLRERKEKEIGVPSLLAKRQK